MWLVLLNIKTRSMANQRELAEAVGLREATLTHHLNGMERDGLITRRRSSTNRRVHVVELTQAGETMFLALRETALAFDARLRQGVSDRRILDLEVTLSRLADNAGEPGIATAAVPVTARDVARPPSATAATGQPRRSMAARKPTSTLCRSLQPDVPRTRPAAPGS